MLRKGPDGGDEEGKNTVFCRLITRHILVIYVCAIGTRATDVADWWARCFI